MDVERTRDPRIRRAMAISARIRTKYPYRDFGRAYFKRGSPDSLASFGPTYREANESQRRNRKELGFTGKGLYRGRGGYWGRWLGSKFGAADLGDRLGDMASSAVSAWNPAIGGAISGLAGAGATMHKLMSGRGEYTSNVIVDGGVGTRVPTFTKTTDGTIILSNKEYICDVYAPDSTGAWNPQTFNINPALEKTFPWLCQIAENYDEYTLHQCIFTYKSTVADFAAASGQVGQVIMATQYNAASSAFPDKQTMMQYMGAVSGKTSQDILQGIECDPAKFSSVPNKFTRNGPPLPGMPTDINTYDHGVMNLAVVDVPSTYLGQQMGELWVSYTIELRKPKFVTANGWGLSRDYFQSDEDDNLGQPFGPTFTGAHTLMAQQNSIGGKLFYANNQTVGTINPPAGPANTIVFPSLACPDSGTFFAAPLDGWNRIVMFGYEIPDTYSGFLRIKFRFIASSVDTGILPIIFQGANARPITDIPNGNGEFLYAAETNYSASGSLDNYMELHVQAKPGGTTIYFTCSPSDAGGMTKGVYLDVTEYNTMFNYKQDGTNDAIVLLNKFGMPA